MISTHAEAKNLTAWKVAASSVSTNVLPPFNMDYIVVTN